MLGHRVAFGLVYGGEPEAVCHHCDNPSCCNPLHLFGGTRADNNRDMVAKGRAAWQLGTQNVSAGPEHWAAKFTDGDVVEIRMEYGLGGVTQDDLAVAWGVCQRTINKIVRGISYV